MMRKASTIKLTFVPPGGYRVDTVTDSTEFDPGIFLTREAVTNLCKKDYWKVTIVRLIDA